MYDSEYFRKVIGNNYNQSDLYTTNTTYVNNEIGENFLADMSKTSANMQETSTNISGSSTDMHGTSTNVSRTSANVHGISTNTSGSSADMYGFLNENQNINVINSNVEQQSLNTSNFVPNMNVTDTSNNIQNEVAYNTNTQVRYPNIYNVLNPMLDTILREKQNIEYNELTIETMCNEIYNALEVDINPQGTNEANTLNNVIAVNAKPKNYLLHDLIKIMLINKIENN